MKRCYRGCPTLGQVRAHLDEIVHGLQCGAKLVIVPSRKLEIVSNKYVRLPVHVTTGVRSSCGALHAALACSFTVLVQQCVFAGKGASWRCAQYGSASSSSAASGLKENTKFCAGGGAALHKITRSQPTCSALLSLFHASTSRVKLTLSTQSSGRARLSSLPRASDAHYLLTPSTHRLQQQQVITSR
jgi:hypothetical protein